MMKTMEGIAEETCCGMEASSKCAGSLYQAKQYVLNIALQRPQDSHPSGSLISTQKGNKRALAEVTRPLKGRCIWCVHTLSWCPANICQLNRITKIEAKVRGQRDTHAQQQEAAVYSQCSPERDRKTFCSKAFLYEDTNKSVLQKKNKKGGECLHHVGHVREAGEAVTQRRSKLLPKCPSLKAGFAPGSKGLNQHRMVIPELRMPGHISATPSYVVA